jgi:hypothetical protein
VNGDDQIEKRLQGLPHRPVPPAWRQEVLSSARAAAMPRPSSRTAPASIRAVLSALLWPHPKAWAGLAAAWLLIFALDFAAREPAQPEIARRAPPVSPQLRELLRQQEQLLAELAGPAETIKAAPAKPAAAPPRSERRESFMRA